ncbi:MAG: hypothetical protein ACOCQP_00445, partial [Lentisphaeria bacterium]
RGGAGSENVQLVKNQHEAEKLVKRAFGRGFSQYNWYRRFKEALRKYKKGKANLRKVLRPLYNALKRHPTAFAQFKGNEKGYVYFQDFIPNNSYDIRIIVIGDKAFGIKRMTRENDFRASGSGFIKHAKEEIDERCVRLAFEINERIKAQSIAFDFVFDSNDKPMMLEISYGFVASVYEECPGFWDKDLTWHEGAFNPCGWMVDLMFH